VRETIV